MKPPHPTQNELLTIEAVLDVGQGAGYVLDFSNPTFEQFMAEHGVAIYDDRFARDGNSKGKRLRCFLATEIPPRTGQVLASLLERRQLIDPLADDELTRYRAAMRRLGAPTEPADASPESSEDALLRLVYRPELLARVQGHAELRDELLRRMDEAQRCIQADALLSAVILCGSVLEGMCLAYGSEHPAAVNKAYNEQFNKPAPHFAQWKLTEWIDVLSRLGVFSPNVAAFGHALRGFRNYVHPHRYLTTGFSPDKHTAHIAFQVVVAAAEGLAAPEGASP